MYMTGEFFAGFVSGHFRLYDEEICFETIYGGYIVNGRINPEHIDKTQQCLNLEQLVIVYRPGELVTHSEVDLTHLTRLKKLTVIVSSNFGKGKIKRELDTTVSQKSDDEYKYCLKVKRDGQPLTFGDLRTLRHSFVHDYRKEVRLCFCTLKPVEFVAK